MKKGLAVIGYGRLGRLAARYLKEDFRVVAHDTSKRVRPGSGVKMVPLREAVQREYIVLALPIGKLRPVLRSMAPLLSPGRVVCDVCSVKEEPIRWMKEILPRHATLLGTHPLFGPDSAARSLMGKTIVLCAVRISRARLGRISRYLASRGLLVRRMSPRRHDALMAGSLFLTQFIGHGLLRLDLPASGISTSNYRRLSEIARTTGHDSLELLKDMYRYNRFAWKTPRLFVRELEALRRELIAGSRRL